MQLILSKGVLLLVSAALISSCSMEATSKHRYEDPFYNDSGQADFKRLPLLKPYWVIFINEEVGILNSSGDMLVADVEQVSVTGDYFLVKTATDQAWAVTFTSKTRRSQFFCVNSLTGDVSCGGSFAEAMSGSGLTEPNIANYNVDRVMTDYAEHAVEGERASHPLPTSLYPPPAFFRVRLLNGR